MIRRLRLLLPVLVLAGAADLRADTLLTGFGGVALGGATDRTRGSYGASLGFVGDGLLGFEVEFATTPEFFGNASEDVFTENSVVTLMGTFLLVAPRGPVRLYGAAGAGLFKTRLADPDRFFDVDSNDFGVNVGGGLLASLGDHVSLRGDVRYFRDLADLEPDGDADLGLGSVDYWRATVGLTLRF